MVNPPPDYTDFLEQSRRQFEKIYPKLVDLYPGAHCELNYRNPYQLLIATILSAQCTDVLVNKVTPALFERFPTPEDIAASNEEEIDFYIQRVTFHRAKSRYLLGMGKMLVEKFHSQVPRTMAELIQIPGAARKTANVVLGNAFGINEGIPVDTHVMRLSQRLALTRNTTPEKIEKDLMRISPQEEWANVSQRLIWHGRRICFARKPNCGICPLLVDCPAGQSYSLMGQPTVIVEEEGEN